MQALLSENKQLAKLARSQEMITRSLEDEQRRREPIAGNVNSPVMPLGDEGTDEEVALLIEGMVEEVAVIGSLCDTLRDRLDCLTRGLDRRGIEREQVGGPLARRPLGVSPEVARSLIRELM